MLNILAVRSVDIFNKISFHPPGKMDLSDYVLSSFSREESKEGGVLEEMLSRGADAVEAIVREDITFAMNNFNAS